MEPTFTILYGAPDTGNGRISRVTLAGAIKFSPLGRSLGAPARSAAGTKSAQYRGPGRPLSGPRAMPIDLRRREAYRSRP